MMILQLNDSQTHASWKVTELPYCFYRVEPAEGKINLEAIARYHAIFKAIQKAGIEPVATLHHFVHPKWFEDKGGFTDEGNLPLFVSFCEIAVREFGQYVLQWVTFNEPAVLCTTGYWFGLFPPGAVSGIECLHYSLLVSGFAFNS
jgi:beta-glucosidase/6-phospho-beta-glucosidase/beta-galactosidase